MINDRLLLQIKEQRKHTKRRIKNPFDEWMRMLDVLHPQALKKIMRWD